MVKVFFHRLIGVGFWGSVLWINTLVSHDDTAN